MLIIVTATTVHSLNIHSIMATTAVNHFIYDYYHNPPCICITIILLYSYVYIFIIIVITIIFLIVICITASTGQPLKLRSYPNFNKHI